MTYGILLVTCPNFKLADRISESLLKKKLIACANILPAIKSKYWWKGKLEKHSEVLLILKTKSSLHPKIEREIKRLHSYDAPEIIFIKIDKANKDYSNWISDVTK